MSTSAKVRATTTAQTIDLVTLRANVAESEKRAYGAKREYAKGLNTIWSFDWFALSHEDTSDEGKAVKAEKEAFYAVLREAGHTNPSSAWGQIKTYGDEERNGKKEKVKDAGSEGAGVPPRDPDVRCKEEATKLYAGIHRMSDASAKSLTFVNAMRDLAKKVYGIDIDKSKA